MVFPEDCECIEARTAQLSFHDTVTIDTSMGTFTNEDLSPLNGLRSPPYTFEFTRKANSVIDLRHTLLEVRFNVVNAKGEPVSRDNDNFRPRDLAVVGNPISSLWKRIETHLNDKLINIESSRNIPHKGIFEDWLDLRNDERAHPQGVRNKYFIGHGPHKNNFYNTYEHSRGKLNDGLTMQYVGHVPVDFLRVNNYLAPRTLLTLTFHPHSSDYALMHAETPGHKIIITDLMLLIRRIYPAAELLPQLPQLGQDTREQYCGRFGTVRDYQMPEGSLRWTQHVIRGDGLLPKFVLVGMVNAEIFGGGVKGSAKRQDPCYFHHYDLNHLSLRAGDTHHPAKPYSPRRMGTTSGGMREYYSMFEQTGLLHPFVTMKEYTHGATIFPFNLRPDMSTLHSRVLFPPKHGPLTIELGFEKPLAHTVSLVVYLLYDQVISIQGTSGFPVEQQF